MPTFSCAASLFILSVSQPDIWDWPVWADHTNHLVPPWHDRATPQLSGSRRLTDTDIRAAQAFYQTWKATSPNQHRALWLNKKGDNNFLGRQVVNRWICHHFTKWNILQIIKKVWIERGRDPVSVMFAAKTSELPKMEDAQVLADTKNAVAEALWGSNAFITPSNPNSMIFPACMTFMRSVMSQLWNNGRKKAVTDVKLYKSKALELNTALTFLTTEGPTVAKIKSFLTKTTAVLQIANIFGDETIANEMNDAVQRLQEMLEILVSKNPAAGKTLPKVLRDAIAKLAKDHEVQMLIDTIRAHIHEAVDNEDNLYDMPNVDDAADPITDWSDGVEKYQDWSEDQLWAAIGRSNDKTLPFFNKVVDKHGDLTQRNDPTYFKTPENVTDLKIRWHQLVGIVKMLDNMFDGTPILLMDDVGLGKTIQVIGFFAMVAWFRTKYEETKNYPGKYLDKKLLNNEGKEHTIPDHPFLFVSMPAIFNQVFHECERYLQVGGFDIIPYTSTKQETHKSTFEEMDARCKTKPGMRIIVAATTALVANADICTHTGSTSSTMPSWSSNGNAKAEFTLFGRRYTSAAVDEAHVLRKPNKTFRAVRFLTQFVDLTFIAMTATPIQNSVSDLWHIGKVLGLKAFSDDQDDKLKEHEKALSKAAREDNKLLKKDKGRIVRGVARGEKQDAAKEADSFFKRAVLDAMVGIRKHFQVSVIHRTTHSKDSSGHYISGLPPYKEFIWVLALYPWEYENLELVLRASKNGSKVLGQFTNKSAFYLHVRQVLLHPDFDGNPCEFSDAEYTNKPSRKLDALLTILRHHLASTNSPGLCLTNDPIQSTADHPRSYSPPDSDSDSDSDSAPHPVPVPMTSDEITDAIRSKTIARYFSTKRIKMDSRDKSVTSPDKILVYVYFTQAIPMILSVLSHRRIKALTLTGSDNHAKRTKTIKDFSKQDGPHVLIISSAAATGLNLDMANILISIDVNWTVQKDQQLIGRIWRHPQPKRVLVYRLIADKTPDIFLNNNCFGKGIIQDAFVNASGIMRDHFNLTDHDFKIDKGESDLEDDLGDGDDSNNKPTKKRAKVKAKSGEPSASRTSKKARKGQSKPVTQTPTQVPRVPTWTNQTHDIPHIAAEPSTLSVLSSATSAPSHSTPPEPSTLSVSSHTTSASSHSMPPEPIEIDNQGGGGSTMSIIQLTDEQPQEHIDRQKDPLKCPPNFPQIKGNVWVSGESMSELLPMIRCDDLLVQHDPDYNEMEITTFNNSDAAISAWFTKQSHYHNLLERASMAPNVSEETRHLVQYRQTALHHYWMLWLSQLEENETVDLPSQGVTMGPIKDSQPSPLSPLTPLETPSSPEMGSQTGNTRPSSASPVQQKPTKMPKIAHAHGGATIKGRAPRKPLKDASERIMSTGSRVRRMEGEGSSRDVRPS